MFFVFFFFFVVFEKELMATKDAFLCGHLGRSAGFVPLLSFVPLLRHGFLFSFAPGGLEGLGVLCEFG